MRILFLGNNWVGWQVLSWLREQGEDVVGVVVHPQRNERYRHQIVEAFAGDAGRIFDAARLHDPATLQAVAALRPDLGVSAYFGYILRREFLSLFPLGVLNLHPAYLPYNRGSYPNVWSIVEGTPAGVSLHFVDEGIDTGDLVARERVEVDVTDTGETLYRKLEVAAVSLFQKTWPLIRAGSAPRIPQAALPEHGTTHRRADVVKIDHINLDGMYRARDLIDVLRARTFPPHRGAFVVVEGRRIYLSLQLRYEESGDLD